MEGKILTSWTAEIAVAVHLLHDERVIGVHVKKAIGYTENKSLAEPRNKEVQQY